MKSKDLKKLGFPSGPVLKAAIVAAGMARKAKMSREDIMRGLTGLSVDPKDFLDHPHFGDLARLHREWKEAREQYADRTKSAPYRQWGEDLDHNSVEQMRNACRLPVSVRGALMPDAHVGYGLPIGGVLAVRNAVIPYAVGVDIACRMKLSVLDLPLDYLDRRTLDLKRAIDQETRFGIGASFKRRRSHPVLDEDWMVTKVTGHVQDRAWSQLGTSGSGNHFVEFGRLTLPSRVPEFDLDPGEYVALLSHSGSRGAGARVADHYCRIAMKIHPELPRELHHLAWLDLGGGHGEGEEYWQAMELMGKYAAANHACIHKHVTKNLGARVLLDVENHHNFAWKEEHDGETLIVHRKGATPASVGTLGVIPGSMASATYLVRGKGNPDSMNSAAHGAGRLMSRKKAKQMFRWKDVESHLASHGVELMSAGLDEVPMVYKDIEKVMAEQSDLVTPLARFFPRLVKMAPAGERPED